MTKRAAALMVALAFVTVLIGSAALAAAASAERARFDTQVFALVPSPGFPARAYVAPNHRVYEGTYTNPSGDSVPSRVLEYSRGGALQRSFTIEGQDLAAEHGVQVATSDARGRLICLDKAPARILSVNPRTGRQRTYATFPDEALPNYAAWGKRGELYVTDYTHHVIWRVPRGGGVAKPWLDDPRLDGGGEFGTTGIVLTADRTHLLVAQQSSAGLGALNPSTGKLYRIEIGADRKPGTFEQVWESGPAEGPDGFAVDRDGNVYMTLLVANQIAVIAPDGTEIERFPTGFGGDNGSVVPYDNPSSAMFFGRRLMIANQAFLTGDTTHMAILDTWIGTRGQPELIPRKAGFRRPR